MAGDLSGAEEVGEQVQLLELVRLRQHARTRRVGVDHRDARRDATALPSRRCASVSRGNVSRRCARQHPRAALSRAMGRSRDPFGIAFWRRGRPVCRDAGDEGRCEESLGRAHLASALAGGAGFARDHPPWQRGRRRRSTQRRDAGTTVSRLEWLLRRRRLGNREASVRR